MTADPILVLARELAHHAGDLPAGSPPLWAQRLAATLVVALDRAGLAVVPAGGRR